MPYDIRQFIEDLKKAGELIEIDEEVDWNYEISAYEILSGYFDGPAFLFNNVKGSKTGARVLVGHFAGSYQKPHKRHAICLGLDPNIDRATWVRQASRSIGTMLKPVEVATGPCKEVIKMGKEANLMEYPFTYHAIGDAAKYIFLNACVIKDPDSNYTNAGTYCLEIYSKNRLAVTPYAHSNFASILINKYWARGEAMPVSIVVGGDPTVTMCAGSIMPPGVSEYDVAGGLRGTPIEMIKSETSDILVPANAEMIIEGEIRPNEFLPEGPKIESFGFSVGPRQPFYAIRVNCITHRANPIIPDIHNSVGAGTSSLHDSFMPLGFLAQIKMFGMPMKLGHTVPVRCATTIFNAVKKKKYPEDYPGFMQQLINTQTGMPGMGGSLANSLFVDDDVNVLNYDDGFEAMFTQVNPARDIIRTEKEFTSMTIESSWLEPEDLAKWKGPGNFLNRKLITDATTKEEPPLGVRRTQFETLFPEELQQWVMDNWKELGFEEEARWNKNYTGSDF